jgi:hypothetical protein
VNYLSQDTCSLIIDYSNKDYKELHCWQTAYKNNYNLHVGPFISICMKVIPEAQDK